MRKLTLAAAVLAVAFLPRADVAAAEEAFIPPIIEATITGMTSQALSDGRWLVSIEADVVNTSDAPLEGVELMLTDAGGLPATQPHAPVVLGTMEVLAPVAVLFELEAHSAHDTAANLHPLIAGSAVELFDEPIAVWVGVQEEAVQ